MSRAVFNIEFDGRAVHEHIGFQMARRIAAELRLQHGKGHVRVVKAGRK